ncbi:MAG: cytochrome c oxidase subunit 4 [Salinigranum sp.]
MSQETGSRPGEPTTTGEGAEGFPHESKYPFFVGLGLFLCGVSLAMFLPLLIAGVPVLAYGIWGWLYEYSVEEFEDAVVPRQKRQLLGVKSGYLAMVLVVGGELVIFAGLFVAWFYLRAERGQFFPPAYPAPSLTNGIALTAIMILSAITIGYARRSISGDDRSGFNWGLALTILLGIAFLVVLAVEWSDLMAAGVDWTTGPYGAAYYVITGVHAVHLLVGLALAGIVGWRGWGRGHFSSDRHLMVSTTELYWYFLAFVSILILAFVYFPTTVA